MRNLSNQIEVIDYYFSKIEEYMSRKHRNSLLKAGGGSGNDLGSDSTSNLSGSPRSAQSDRMNT